MNVQTTLNFFGRTEEALEFYCEAVEAEILFMMRFNERPDNSNSQPDLDEKVFHATLRIGSTQIMASDAGCIDTQKDTSFDGFSLALRVESPDKAEQVFSALSEGGQIMIPLAETFFASRYGIVTDRFGLSWKVIVESKSD